MYATLSSFSSAFRTLFEGSLLGEVEYLDCLRQSRHGGSAVGLTYLFIILTGAEAFTSTSNSNRVITNTTQAPQIASSTPMTVSPQPPHRSGILLLNMIIAMMGKTFVRATAFEMQLTGRARLPLTRVPTTFHPQDKFWEAAREQAATQFAKTVQDWEDQTEMPAPFILLALPSTLLQAFHSLQIS